MPEKRDHGSFDKWREAQRQLHALERQVRDFEREHKSRRGPQVPERLVARLQELRLEVDSLFPAAMKELEERVSEVKSRRPKLGEL
ncbi:hypothetical protein [Ramlibacter algicola]|uniref:Uncharacterized protein n=1 Tax=Ramlibacter algicola TaxID=2795217 RepID=A0A934Q2F1_9BURK|nr:hypothetical protein [Ramlibacter algicola]MBK0394895.1 hypothetical protein [Ramlibacter algicola]